MNPVLPLIRLPYDISTQDGLETIQGFSSQLADSEDETAPTIRTLVSLKPKGTFAVEEASSPSQFCLRHLSCHPLGQVGLQ